MSQISKRLLKPEVEEKIRGLLVECVNRCRDQQTTANFIDVLLTDTEKTMIAKRIAIALMLLKGYSPVEIDEKLKVSLGTIYTVQGWLAYKGAEYKSLLVEIVREDEGREKEHKLAVWEAEETTPRWGTSWKSEKQRQWQKVRRTKVPF